jgi:hypothetical protein
MVLLRIKKQKSAAGSAYALNLILLIVNDSLDVITWVQGETLLNDFPYSSISPCINPR